MKQETNEKKKVGRPTKYPYEMLKKYLLEYATQNVGGLIRHSDLVKFSGLPLQAWRFNKQINEDIKKLNTVEIIPSDILHDNGLPSAEDIVNANYKNKDRLIGAFSDLINLYQKAYSEIAKLRKDAEKLEQLESEIKILKNEVKHYKNEMMKLTVKSSTAIGRAETGIGDNVINIKASEVENVFSDLFDD